MNLTGYRTILINGLVVILVAALQYVAGIDWTQYVSPSIGVMIVGAVNLVLRYVTTTPIGQATPPVTTVNSTKQGGFTFAGFLAVIGALVLLTLFFGLTACAAVQAPIPNQIAAASLTVMNITQQASLLEHQHIISAETEDSILSRLTVVNADLRRANALMVGCAQPCNDVTALLGTINQTLIGLQGELPAITPTVTPISGVSK